MFYFNRDEKVFVAAGIQYTKAQDAYLPALYYGDEVALELQCVTRDGTPVPLEGASYALAVDTNFLHDDELMCYSEDIDISGAAEGKLICNFSCFTVAFGEKAIAQTTKAWFELIEYLPGEPEGRVILQSQVFTRPRVLDNEGTPATPSPEYVTVPQLTAAVAAVQTIDGVMLPLDKVEYTDELGYYAELVNTGDTVKSVYNAYGVSSVQLLVKSANSAITGTVEVAVNGIPWQLPAGADYAWQRLDIPSTISGVITVELVTGLSDGDAAVGLLIGGMMVRDNVAPQYSGALQQYVSAKPLLYRQQYGYFYLLDNIYNIAFTQWVQNCTAIALRIVTANQAFTGNVYLNVTVGGTTKAFTVPVTQTLSWVLLPLDSAVSGQVTITRDSTNSADTLKDGSSVVSAGVGSINYYYNI